MIYITFEHPIPIPAAKSSTTTHPIRKWENIRQETNKRKQEFVPKPTTLYFYKKVNSQKY